MEIKKPLHIHSNIVAIIFLVGGVLLTPFLAYILWRICKVHSRVKGLKPMMQLFSEKKGEVFNVNAVITNRLHTLEAKLTSPLGSITVIPGTELALPSTSHKPELPPRRDSLPMVELNVTQQTIQEIWIEKVPRSDITKSIYRGRLLIQERNLLVLLNLKIEVFTRSLQRLCKITCL